MSLVDPNTMQRIDDLLFSVTQQANNGVEGLLDSVYGFLQRRTDFFYESEPGDKMGFPPGIAESMTYGHFRRYQELHQKRFPPKPETKKRWEQYNAQQKKLKEEQKTAIQEAAQASLQQQPSQGQASGQIAPAKAAQPNQEQKVEEVKKPAEPPKPKSENLKEMEKISTYNGDTTDKYNWSQNITEVIMQIPIPEGTSSKQLKVVIKAKHLYVELKGGDILLDGELQEKVKIDDSYWSIEDRKYLNITFEKGYEAIWKTVMIGDQEIDTKKVDNSKRIEEFDLETQGHLQKVLYEQERKRQGLPTTDEEKNQQLMESIMAKQSENGMNPMDNLPYDPKKYGQNKMGSGAGPPIPFKQ